MSADATTGYTPLHDPETDALSYVLPLDSALRHARAVLDEQAPANIHDRDEMLRAAVSLEMRLRQLVAAIDKKAGR